MTNATQVVAGTAPSTAQGDWRRQYAGRLALSDLLVLVWVVFGVQIAWLGLDSEAAGFSGSTGDIQISYTAISVILIVCWMAALAFFDSRTDRVVGLGATEYRLVAGATVRLFGVLAIIAFLFKIDLARGYVLIAFPAGMVVLLFSRWLWRQWLGVQRQKGRYSSLVLLVGSSRSVAHIADQLTRQPDAGYRVVGVCVPNVPDRRTEVDQTMPIVGDLDDIGDAIGRTGADTVIITSSDELSPDKIRELSWSLEPGLQHLVVAPSLTGISGPRIHTRPVAGLPLIHVETPRYAGRKVLVKRGVDILASAFLLLVLSPVFFAIAVAIKMDSRGPLLFRQERIGIQGQQFSMLKFRSMVSDAEDQLIGLGRLDRAEGNQVLFKMRDDPRVTRVGRVIRRFSLDELPQLFNVLGGAMSLVGPRPPLEREVMMYEKHVHRRFLVKPGITGLWQVSGRSNLSWEDSVRLDLYYVENWSLAGDLVILWRTAKAVLGREGAY